MIPAHLIPRLESFPDDPRAAPGCFRRPGPAGAHRPGVAVEVAPADSESGGGQESESESESESVSESGQESVSESESGQSPSLGHRAVPLSDIGPIAHQICVIAGRGCRTPLLDQGPPRPRPSSMRDRPVAGIGP